MPAGRAPHTARDLVAAMTLMPIMAAAWALLMPVIPLEMTRAGSSTSAASANTALFMAAAVVAQFVTPRALHAWGYRTVIAGCALMLGLPAMVMVVSSAPWWWNAIAVVRGVAFGALSVACVAIPSVIAPERLLGRVAAVQGVTISLVQAIGFGGGLALSDAIGGTTVFLIGGGLPLLICVAIRFVPPVTDAGADPESFVRVQDTPVRRIVNVVLIGGMASAAFGGLSVLLPITETAAGLAVAALTTMSLALMAGRYVAGALTDRGRHGILTLPAVGVVAVSMLAIGLAPTESGRTAIVVGASITFGFAFGLLQNDSLVTLYRLFADRGRATASKWWNVSMDLGMGVGSFALGAVASGASADAAYIVAGVAVAVTAPLFRSMFVTQPAPEPKRRT